MKGHGDFFLFSIDPKQWKRWGFFLSFSLLEMFFFLKMKNDILRLFTLAPKCALQHVAANYMRINNFKKQLFN